MDSTPLLLYTQYRPALPECRHESHGTCIPCYKSTLRVQGRLPGSTRLNSAMSRSAGPAPGARKQGSSASLLVALHVIGEHGITDGKDGLPFQSSNHPQQFLKLLTNAYCGLLFCRDTRIGDSNWRGCFYCTHFLCPNELWGRVICCSQPVEARHRHIRAMPYGSPARHRKHRQA